MMKVYHIEGGPQRGRDQDGRRFWYIWNARDPRIPNLQRSPGNSTGTQSYDPNTEDPSRPRCMLSHRLLLMSGERKEKEKRGKKRKLREADDGEKEIRDIHELFDVLNDDEKLCLAFAWDT